MAEPPRGPPREPIRVLLVDDDPVFGTLLAGAFADRDGRRPETASTTAEALDRLRARPVDAVVSDCDTARSKRAGVDLYRAVRRRWPSLPFVFFTGTPAVDLSDAVDLRGDPAVAYVRKGCLPERLRALAQRVGRAVERDGSTDRGRASAARAIESFCR